MSASILNYTIDRFGLGNELAQDYAEAFLDALITETDEALIASVLTAWHKKGIEEEEIYSIGRIMRDRMTRIESKHRSFVDIVGTGGSKSKTFNVSTAASFVVAGAGIPVAKHGNKAATSNSGSADVLSELGINPAVDPISAERCLNEVDICFMFAPNFHRLSPTLGNVRRGLGFPTIFNCVGPICNPASAPHQVIGVWDKELVPKIARALARLGTTRTWVVCGHNGLDEIALEGKTFVAEVQDNTVREFEIAPEVFGFEVSDIAGLRAANSNQSAEMIRNLLWGRPQSEAAKDLVLINASAALYIAGAAENPEAAEGLARNALNSGQAYSKLEELVAATPS